MLQLRQKVSAEPLFGFVFDTPLLEFRHEHPIFDPLFALPTTSGILTVPSYR